MGWLRNKLAIGTLSVALALTPTACTILHRDPAISYYLTGKELQIYQEYKKELKGHFKKKEIDYLFTENVPKGYAIPLSKIYSAKSIYNLFRSGIDDNQGKRRYDTVPLEYALKFGLIKDKIQHSEQEYLAYYVKLFYVNSYSTGEIEFMLDYFHKLSIVSGLLKRGVSQSSIETILNLETREGFPFVDNGKDFQGLFFWRLEDSFRIISLDYIRGMLALAENGVIDSVNAFKIRRFYDLGYSPDCPPIFEDTEKPNCVFVYPTSDWNGGFESYIDFNLFQRVKDEYDIKLIIAETEGEVYKALRSTPNIKLFILSGHGTRKSLRLGKKDLSKNPLIRNEEYFFDIRDIELGEHLTNLDSDAVIYLPSCSTGKWRKLANNLANFFSKQASGRTIISPSSPMEQEAVLSINPFIVMCLHNGKDVTYVINPRKN